MDANDTSDHNVPGKMGEHPELGWADPGKLVLAVNGVIAGVGGVYASTHSLAATLMAGGVGLACAVVLASRR